MPKNPLPQSAPQFDSTPTERTDEAIQLRLALAGQPASGAVNPLFAPVLARQVELSRRLADRLPPVDQRIQAFLDRYLTGIDAVPQLPKRSFVLDQAGLARALSLPRDRDEFVSDIVSSYRVANGVLHNPANDRRTTAGVFHVAEGGLPIAEDKRAVPREVYAALLSHAFTPPAELLKLPYNADEPDADITGCFVSLLMRPVVLPAVGDLQAQKSLETRFIVPGGLVSNLDFVEQIFGNAGDPYLPENDSALDPATWTGHTGCVVLAPHLTRLTKRELGLPHIDDATDRQRRDRLCWTDPDELYNDGQAFKVTARDESGVMVTAIADNYFGYCKKEVKTQISFSANLHGLAEEEHSGGAIAFPSYTLGAELLDAFSDPEDTVARVVADDPERFEAHPEGFALDRDHPGFIVVPSGAHYSLREETIRWTDEQGAAQTIPLRSDATYFTPSGYRVRLEPLADNPREWTLIGTTGEGSSFHKPSTVSGGGKSEISKAISDAFRYGTAYVRDFAADMDAVAEIISRDFTNRFADPAACGVDHRSVLGPERSVGSVIKLLTPSDDFSDDYNAWLASVPAHIKKLIYIIKRHYQPSWGDDWRSHFSVAVVDGRPGNVLRLDGHRVPVAMLRVGYEQDGSWRLFSLRPDFAPAVKLQTEDDITASTVLAPAAGEVSRKYVYNTEGHLFQRPDDAVIRGYDAQAEADIAGPGTFLSNFEPLTRADAVRMASEAIGFGAFTPPMRDLIAGVADSAVTGAGPDYFVASCDSRLVDGKPSKNPRYLQLRPDLADPRATAASDLALHLYRNVSTQSALAVPIDVVVAGRRNNPPEADAPPLCAFGPLHHLELPELFMEFISSMTGKSPSTTGAGSEGALTKAPFNALPTIYDLNASLLSYALTGYDGWISSAGWLGPRVRIDHDVSLLVPEVFARMRPEERSAAWLLEHGYLEPVPDLEYEGRAVPASLLGHRITRRFVTAFFGRVFTNPEEVFTEQMLRPELQDLGVFVDSVEVTMVTHQRVAQNYFADGSIEFACPPLRALLEIMAHGQSAEGHTLSSPEFRAGFEREAILASDWYAARLNSGQIEAMRRAEDGVAALRHFIAKPENAETVQRLELGDRLRAAEVELARVSSAVHRGGLVGTIGRQDRLK